MYRAYQSVVAAIIIGTSFGAGRAMVAVRARVGLSPGIGHGLVLAAAVVTRIRQA